MGCDPIRSSVNPSEPLRRGFGTKGSQVQILSPRQIEGRSLVGEIHRAAAFVLRRELLRGQGGDKISAIRCVFVHDFALAIDHVVLGSRRHRQRIHGVPEVPDLEVAVGIGRELHVLVPEYSLNPMEVDAGPKEQGRCGVPQVVKAHLPRQCTGPELHVATVAFAEPGVGVPLEMLFDSRRLASPADVLVTVDQACPGERVTKNLLGVSGLSSNAGRLGAARFDPLATPKVTPSGPQFNAAEAIRTLDRKLGKPPGCSSSHHQRASKCRHHSERGQWPSPAVAGFDGAHQKFCLPVVPTSSTDRVDGRR